MMRKWILILGVLLWTSCFDDLGNYDYTDLGEMTISGVVNNRYYELFAYADTLYIPVTIESSRYTKGEEPYVYQWKLIGTNAQTEDKDNNTMDYTVSREKDLKIVPQLNAGDYFGFFWVTDTLLGVSQKVDFFVRLRTTISEGWMILCEENNETRLDWIIPLSDTSERISRNIWATQDFKLGKPYKITNCYRLQGSNRYIFTERGTYNIDRYDAHVGEDNDARWNFGDIPARVDGLAAETALMRRNKLDMLLTRDKDLYVRAANDVNSIYGYPINKTADGQRFDVAPYFGHARNSGTGVSVIIYDETNRRFMQLDDDEVVVPHPLVLQSDGTVRFDVETGRDMVFMDYTMDGYTFAVLRDPNDRELYIYGIKVEVNNKNFPQYYMKLNYPRPDEVQYIAFHSLYRYMFFTTTNNELYQFDMEHPDTPAKLVKSYPGETIRALKLNKMVAWEAYKPWERARENQLVVGTVVDGMDESDCGIMRIYEVPSLMKPLELRKEYTRLGNLIDIVYRERDK